MKSLAIAAALAAALVSAPRAAEAFCGFYVAGSDQALVADATQVVLMRKGTRTVLSMQNNYKGPTDAFAMVIPVPVVLKERDVKTLPVDVFKRVEQMGAPRLVEYWEQDPCRVDEDEEAMPAKSAVGSGRRMMKKAKGDDDDLGVSIEAQFAVGEYQIVILSAKDSTGLDTWLRREKYNIPKGAEPLLRPYVESGMKFFVAKVDPKKVKFVDGRADLSPLRFHYDHPEFTLPIRLGLASSGGTQDLIVSILAPGQRYEVANYKNVTIPTNLDVKDGVRGHFGAFYAALFDRTLEKNPGAVVTEYAWQATTCDPCPGPTLGQGDFLTLGADVLEPGQEIVSPGPGLPPAPVKKRSWGGGSGDFVLTRLHARYGKDISNDLVFRAAAPIVGGREHVVGGNGKLEEGAQASSINNFQGRYAIRHRWTGPVACASPRRGIWGGPPDGGMARPEAALGLAFAPRAEIKLPAVVVGDVPELGLRKGALEPVGKPK